MLPKEAMDGLAMEYRAIANESPELAVSTVAITVLTSVIERSKATTMMGLEKEIKEAAAVLRRYGHLVRCVFVLIEFADIGSMG